MPDGSRRALSALPGCQPRLWPAHRRRVAQAARAEVLRLRHRRLLASGLHQRGRAGVRRRRPQRLRRGCVRHIQLQGNQRRARRRGRRRSPLHRVRCPEGQLDAAGRLGASRVRLVRLPDEARARGAGQLRESSQHGVEPRRAKVHRAPPLRHLLCERRRPARLEGHRARHHRQDLRRTGRHEPEPCVRGDDAQVLHQPRRHHRAVSQQPEEGRLQGLLPAHRARPRRGGLLGGGARALGAPHDGHHCPRSVRARARTGQSDIDARLPRPAPGARAPRVARATGREPRADIDEPLAAGFLQRPSHERDLQPCRKRDGSEGLHQLRSDGIISRELAGYLHLPARADPRYGREGPAGRFWQRVLVAWHGRQLPVRHREDRQVLRRRDRGQDDGARRNRLDNRDVPPHRHEDGRRGRRDARSSRSTSSTWST